MEKSLVKWKIKKHSCLQDSLQSSKSMFDSQIHYFEVQIWNL